jgi:glyoxylase-like metal-dependent hydrolase (beta-lactamase superfamily II)
MTGVEKAGMSSVVPLSRFRQQAWWERDRPEPAEIVRGVWTFAIPIPGGGPLPWTLCYALISGDDVHIIDPGWDSDDSLAALTESLHSIGVGLDQVRSAIATHHHLDHLGLCARLRDLTGAALILSEAERRVLAQETSGYRTDPVRHAEMLEAWGVPAERGPEVLQQLSRPSPSHDAEPDRLLHDGELLELGEHRLRVVFTPGHSDGHICFVDDERRLLYAGDHLLPEIHSGIGLGMLPGSDPLASYLASLDLLESWDGYRVLPGHGYAFDGLQARRTETTGHHIFRSSEVAALLPRLRGAPTWEYARHLTWSGGWESLRGFTLVSALRQTNLHREFVLSGRAEPYLTRLG